MKLLCITSNKFSNNPYSRKTISITKKGVVKLKLHYKCVTTLGVSLGDRVVAEPKGVCWPIQVIFMSPYPTKGRAI
jgi:hypothetical protein